MLKGGSDRGWPDLGAETSCAKAYPCDSNCHVVMGICQHDESCWVVSLIAQRRS